MQEMALGVCDALQRSLDRERLSFKTVVVKMEMEVEVEHLHAGPCSTSSLSLAAAAAFHTA